MDLFSSPKAKESGVNYLDREVQTIAYYTSASSELMPIKIYGNPLQPEFSGNSYPFTYAPHPSPGSLAAWANAPKASDGVQIWAMHSPPMHRLDLTNVKGLTGCVVQAEKIASAKPLLCVFGHFHYSWGVERVQWEEHGDGIARADILTLSKERKLEQNLDLPETQSVFDFSGIGIHDKVYPGKETIFVNAAWMTMKKAQIEERNQPLVITMSL
jgi:hypothetical protein